MFTSFRTDSLITSSPQFRGPALESARTPTIPTIETAAWRTDVSRAVFINASAPPSATRASATPEIDRRTLALMAADVYQARSTPPPGYREASAADLSAIGLKPENLKSANGEFLARVYAQGTGADAHYVVSMRGSRPDKLTDWVTNARQGVGLDSIHYQQALRLGNFIARSSNPNVTFTGHSLGGGLASAAALASGRNATTFNAAGLSSSTIRASDQIRNAAGVAARGQVEAVFVRGEVLSGFQDGGDRAVGSAIGGAIGGPIGRAIGGALVDAPAAYGRRVGLDAVRPDGTRWYQDNAVARHGMDYVLASLGR